MRKKTNVMARAVVTATALALLAGLTGVPAQAAPQGTQAAQAAAVPESTMEDKVRAAAVLGVAPGAVTG